MSVNIDNLTIGLPVPRSATNPVALEIPGSQALQQYPELEAVLNMLAGRINDSLMTELNFRADYLHELPEKIAKDFLLAQGIWKDPREGHKGIVKIGSKIFAEQYILCNMYAMLIRGYTGLDVETKTGLGGTKICFDALANGQIDMYPEYTGTGLLVLLQPPADTINELITDREAVYNYVQANFMKRYSIKWLKPIGFNNAYALMMRRGQAGALQLKTISDLKAYIDSN